MRFVHTADWQIGARFRQFGEKAAWLRATRVRTLERALAHAERIGADGFLIAGDLFEDHGVGEGAVAQVFELLASFSRVPVFVLPGNHDPAGGASAVWSRKPFVAPPAHVKVFLAPEAVPLAEGWLLASPLAQKRSRIDPSLRLDELARGVPAEAIKVGMTHGSPAIAGNHQPDDFPIAVDAATRGGLDYLAIGHWHGALPLDGGRLLMPGTPEPTDFSETNAGHVQVVEIAACGARPAVSPVAVAELRWSTETLDFATAPEPEAVAERLLQGVAAAERGRLVLRLILRGSAAPARTTEYRARLEAALAGCAIVDVKDETLPELSETEWAAVRQEHPLLAQVLADLDGLAEPAAGAPLSIADLSALCEKVGCAAHQLTPELLQTARRMLLHEFRESCAAC